MSEAFLRTALVFHPVTDVVARGVVVAAVNVLESGAVEVDRDGRALAGVSDPVDAPVAREHGRGPVIRAPAELPRLLQAGVLLLRAVVEAVVALLEHRSGGAGVGAPRGVVVDPGPRLGRPDKDLQRVRAVMGVVAAGQVPAFGVPRFPEQG